ncbi:hypothetical protein [Streptomyces sp. NPDC059783]
MSAAQGSRKFYVIGATVVCHGIALIVEPLARCYGLGTYEQGTELV